mmetsp:Transcript_42851/g.118461  ORF Transcript_42851/g.118461 Transcript_42851/m.118461 type:complete len:215 (-) Transcript_42851:663-1307(-)
MVQTWTVASTPCSASEAVTASQQSPLFVVSMHCCGGKSVKLHAEKLTSTTAKYPTAVTTGRPRSKSITDSPLRENWSRPSHVYAHSMTSPATSSKGTFRLCMGTPGSRDQVCTSLCAGGLKRTSKCSDLSRANASPSPPTMTLSRKCCAMVGYRSDASAGRRRVNPSIGKPANLLVTSSTRKEKRRPSRDAGTGLSPTTKQPRATSEASRRITL